MSFIDFLSLDFYGETWIVILRTLGVIISLPILYIFLKTIQSLRYALIDKRAMRKAFSLEISPKVTKQHFLVLGDSIAFGTGARDVHNSIVGRLARDYPEAHINNKAENGSHTIEIANKMHQIEEEFFDLAILIVG